MTIKLVALWGIPDNTDGFDKDYEATHAALVAKLPGMAGAILSKALDGPYHRMAELIFDDADKMGAALGSPEGGEVLADAGRLQETYGAKLDVMTVEEQTRI